MPDTAVPLTLFASYRFRLFSWTELVGLCEVAVSLVESRPDGLLVSRAHVLGQPLLSDELEGVTRLVLYAASTARPVVVLRFVVEVRHPLALPLLFDAGVGYAAQDRLLFRIAQLDTREVDATFDFDAA